MSEEVGKASAGRPSIRTRRRGKFSARIAEIGAEDSPEAGRQGPPDDGPDDGFARCDAENERTVRAAATRVSRPDGRRRAGARPSPPAPLPQGERGERDAGLKDEAHGRGWSAGGGCVGVVHERRGRGRPGLKSPG